MFHHTFAAMNTRLSMVLPALDEDQGRACARAVERLVREQEDMMSRFRAHAELATLNQHAGDGPEPVSERLWEVLQACRRHHALTNGAFDIALAGGEPGQGMAALRFDPVARTLQFADAGVRLDLGAIGKGIALDLVKCYLAEQDAGPVFLSFGESSIAVIGAHPGADHWPVGVEHLYRPGHALHCFDLRDAAMSTSGNRAGEGHIVDPRSGRLLTACRTMSVACASATDAEVLSTALLVLPPEERDAVVRRYPGARAVAITYRKTRNGWRARKDWHHEH
jgi:thiamine biosynthesis lipoprotein